MGCKVRRTSGGMQSTPYFWWDPKYAVLLLPPRPESKTAGDLSYNPAVMWAERASDVQWQMDSVVP